jgi:hypothetical protein
MTAEDKAFRIWSQSFNVICKEVTDLVIGRYIFLEVQHIIKENPKIQKPSSFYGLFGITYRDWAVMNVRRQLDNRTDSVSLVRLLREMAQKPQVLSRQRYVATYADELMRGRSLSPSSPGSVNKRQSGAYRLCRFEAEQIANVSFDGYAGSGNTHIPKCVIERDRVKFEEAGDKIKTFANKRVAHLDKSPPTRPPSSPELDPCIELLERLVLKYEFIFEASAPQSLLPTWQYDWKAIFYDPWIPVSGLSRKV